MDEFHLGDVLPTVGLSFLNAEVFQNGCIVQPFFTWPTTAMRKDVLEQQSRPRFGLNLDFGGVGPNHPRDQSG